MEETVSADRVIVMSEGEVVMDGTPSDIFGDTERVRRYHLELPISDYLAEKIREAGIPLPQKIYDERSLAEEICRSK